MVIVHGDPRQEIPLEMRKTKLQAYQEYKGIVEKASKAYDQLQDARKSIRIVQEALANTPDSVRQEVIKTGKALQDSIAALELLYMMPQGLKGIQRSADNLSSLLRGAAQYFNTSDGAPNGNAQNILDQTKKQAASVLERVNVFFEGDFKTYREKVQALPFSFFKPVESIKLE